MLFQLGADVEAYVVSRSVGYGPAGTALAGETAALGEPAVMMIAKEQYAVLRFLAGVLGSKRALDVGTFTGLSALAFADGMGADGRVTTIDRNPAWVDVARRHWHAAGVAERIDVRIGEAIDVLADLAADGQARYDIALLDVDKARVGEYFEQVLGMLAPGGVIMIDNAMWHGWVLDHARADTDTDGMRRFNERVAADARLEAVLLPIADGLWLVRRRG
jgi:predicted O-methyltransferase YrrM